MNTENSDGLSTLLPSIEITDPSTDVLEAGRVEKTKTPQSPRLTGEVKVRAFNFLTSYEPPRAYFATDHGTFYIVWGDAQIASYVEDASAYIAKKIRDAAPAG